MHRVLDYLRDTINDVHTIGADDLGKLYMRVGASNAVHPNMCSHTGGATSFGRGIIHGKLSKQKLNTKSSTEAELVAVSDYLPYHIWMVNFLKYQGYEIKEKILYQDNQSTSKMKVNCWNSCTGNSRHIDIRYFFVHDRVKKGELNVTYCPTDNVSTDLFTKPLQGAIFKKFRSAIMGFVDQNVNL